MSLAVQRYENLDIDKAQKIIIISNEFGFDDAVSNTAFVS